VSFRLSRVASLLFFSGACALVYQVAWFRELRLIFGASTSSSAAVLAVFMGGLGVGGALLGRRADASRNPLAFYANLEIVAAVTAAITPASVWLAEKAYLGVGGASVLGDLGATVVRLLLSVLVLGPSTVAMGGTMPAAARAVERASDAGRQRMATLYGVNTFGAVVGTMLSNFLLVEVFGNRVTLWLACLVNLLVGVVARAVSRSESSRDAVTPPASDAVACEASAALPERDAPGGGARFPWFPKVAAAVAGLAFMLMELVWYRMLGPILGGSAYTFGLILGIALLGIGIGGAIYARTRGAATLTLFGATCALEALVVAVPYAIGDRLAIFAGLLRPLAKVSFGGSIVAWSLVASVVVLPGAIVSGFQFPVIVGLYGRGEHAVGRDVGQAYLANTMGSIVGSLAGGFGLLPLLSAPRVWALVCALLAATALLAAALEVRGRSERLARAVALVATPAALASALLFARGPTSLWRHAGIGAGRADATFSEPSADALGGFRSNGASDIAWEVDGRESSVALSRSNGYAFVVNGKVDGHAVREAGTQIMSGLLAALLHPEPRRALVIGLGPGSSAGWLGALPGMESVDAYELEPAIVRVARDCAPVNQDVTNNPKVRVHVGDARELLRTSRARYDIVFSEPSNPYRAGISSLFTKEYYEAVRERLAPGGIFAQWTQAYEIDGWVIGTVVTTLRAVFPHVSIWTTERGDLLLLATLERNPIDVERLRVRVREEPVATALRAAWSTSSAEGVLAHHIATPDLSAAIVEHGLGVVNTDDQNLLEFAFARGVGHAGMLDEQLAVLATRLGRHRPEVTGSYDEKVWTEEKLLAELLPPPVIAAAAWQLAPDVGELKAALESRRAREGLATWRSRRARPRSLHEAMLVVEAAARSGDEAFPALLPAVMGEAERKILQALWLDAAGRGADVVPAIEQAILAMRADPWVSPRLASEPLALAVRVGAQSPVVARQLADLLAVPFSVEQERNQRLSSHIVLGRATRDPAFCVAAIDRAGGGHFWSRDVLQARVECFRSARDPRLASAIEDLDAYMAFRIPFGASIPGPPPLPRAHP
jgi:spermidine synthase